MKNLLFLMFAATLLLQACKKNVNPDGDEYFSFYADGEYFDYPQEKGLGFSGKAQLIEAYSSNSVALGYVINARSVKKPEADGGFTFYLSGSPIPDRDTIILVKGRPTAIISNFKEQFQHYAMGTYDTGMIIFTERSSSRITGTFYFEAASNSAGPISITGGKFSIIPTK